MEEWFKGVAREAQSRKDGIIPGVEEFIPIRRQTSAIALGFHMIEYALGIELPEKVLEDPTFQTLFNCAVDFIALKNVSKTTRKSLSRN